MQRAENCVWCLDILVIKTFKEHWEQYFTSNLPYQLKSISFFLIRINMHLFCITSFLRYLNWRLHGSGLENLFAYWQVMSYRQVRWIVKNFGLSPPDLKTTFRCSGCQVGQGPLSSLLRTGKEGGASAEAWSGKTTEQRQRCDLHRRLADQSEWPNPEQPRSEKGASFTLQWLISVVVLRGRS